MDFLLDGDNSFICLDVESDIDFYGSWITQKDRAAKSPAMPRPARVLSITIINEIFWYRDTNDCLLGLYMIYSSCVCVRERVRVEMHGVGLTAILWRG